MNYEETLQYIHSMEQYGSKLDLSRITALLECIGNPHLRVRCIHVAGTNGKGSTCAMTASVLKAAGYKTGLFVSPFVEEFRERIRLDGEYIPKSELCRIITYLRGVIEENGLLITEFELITAAGFYFFCHNHCDAVVLEVGLGGRLDATNVIKTPLVSVITPLALDHTHILGGDIARITTEKCGIIKPGCPVVTAGGQEMAAMDIIRACCNEKNSELHVAPCLTPVVSDESGVGFEYDGKVLRTALVGAHQARNAQTVCIIVSVLRRAGFEISDDALARGLAGVHWSGRLERISDKPAIYIDGAHNLHAIEALAASCDTLVGDRKLITVMGMMKDKNYGDCIGILARRSHAFVAMQLPGKPRSLSSAEVFEAARLYCENVYDCDSPEKAAAQALEIAAEDDFILACGSLYMIGDFKREIVKIQL